METPNLTERGGIVLNNGRGGFYAYLTITGTDEWREISWVPGRDPPLRTDRIVATQQELTAHIRKNFSGWVAKKNNVPDVALEHNAEIPHINALHENT